MKAITKILPAVAVAALLSFTAQAQSGTMQEEGKMPMKNKPMQSKSMENCVMMKGGKMMVMKDGKTMPMTSEMTMNNDTKVMTDGKVMMADGKSMTLHDGQCVMMDGRVMDDKMMHKGMKHKM